MIAYYLVAGGAVGLAFLGRMPRGRHRPTHALVSAARRPLVAGWSAVDLVLVLGLSAFSAFRYGIGTDFGLYTALYRNLDPADWVGSIQRSPQEIGFTVLSLALRGLGPDPRPLFIICSVVTVWASYAALRRGSTALPLSIAVYLLFAEYLQPFNTVRQGLAIALLFFGNRFLGRRWVLWAAMVLLATSFHTTALFAALVQLAVLRWRPTVRTSALLVVIVGVGGGLLIHLPAVVQWLGAINPRYAVYLASGGSGIGTYLMAAVWIALLGAAFVLDHERHHPRWLAYGTLAVLFTVIGTFSPDVGRMADYFTPYFALLIPAVVDRSRRRIPLMIGLVAVGTVFFTMFLLSFDGLLPYRAGV